MAGVLEVFLSAAFLGFSAGGRLSAAWPERAPAGGARRGRRSPLLRAVVAAWECPRATSPRPSSVNVTRNAREQARTDDPVEVDFDPFFDFGDGRAVDARHLRDVERPEPEHGDDPLLQLGVLRYRRGAC